MIPMLTFVAWCLLAAISQALDAAEFDQYSDAFRVNSASLEAPLRGCAALNDVFALAAHEDFVMPYLLPFVLVSGLSDGPEKLRPLGPNVLSSLGKQQPETKEE